MIMGMGLQAANQASHTYNQAANQAQRTYEQGAHQAGETYNQATSGGNRMASDSGYTSQIPSQGPPPGYGSKY